MELEEFKKAATENVIAVINAIAEYDMEKVSKLTEVSRVWCEDIEEGIFGTQEYGLDMLAKWLRGELELKRYSPNKKNAIDKFDYDCFRIEDKPDKKGILHADYYPTCDGNYVYNLFFDFYYSITYDGKLKSYFNLKCKDKEWYLYETL